MKDSNSNNFKCVGQVATGKRCKVQCTLCKRAYEPKTEKE